MGTEEVLTAPHSPWQNRFAERWIGSIRPECRNHVLALSERHLHRILTHYFAYYLFFDKTPSSRQVVNLSEKSKPDRGGPLWIHCKT